MRVQHRIRGEIENQMVGINRPPAPERQRARDHGFQLVQIAEPEVISQTLRGIGGNRRLAQPLL